MKWMIRCVVAVCSIIGGIKAMPVNYASSGDCNSCTIRYVALGDSIAYGYGLDNRERDSYVGQVRKYLESRGNYVILTNLGENGMRSDELLDILTDPENEKYRKYRATLSYADVITISIGSNDLLHLIKLNINMEDVIREGDGKFQKACLQFAYNFPRIVEEIRKVNPDAKIYANNIYNPAKGISAYASVYNIAERYINLLNKAFVSEEDYDLVDIKKAFDRQTQSMVNLSLNGREIDPHPSKEGHRLMGQMVIKRMTE